MSPDWLGASRRAASALRAMLGARTTIAERVLETGTRGEGGDRTLEIDAAAEEAVFAELEALHRAGARFTVVSEERGWVAWLDGGRLDPALGDRRTRDGRLEVIGVESADPRWVRDSADALADSAHRLRALG